MGEWIKVCVLVASAVLAPATAVRGGSLETAADSVASLEGLAARELWSQVQRELDHLLRSRPIEELRPLRDRIVTLHFEAQLHQKLEWPGLASFFEDGAVAKFDDRRNELIVEYSGDALHALEGFEQRKYGSVFPVEFSDVTLYAKCKLTTEARQCKPVVLTHVLEDQRMELRLAWCQENSGKLDAYLGGKGWRLPTRLSTEKPGFDLVPGKMTEFKVIVYSDGRTRATVNGYKVFDQVTPLPSGMQPKGQIGVTGLPGTLRELSIRGTVDPDWHASFKTDWRETARSEFEESYDRSALLDAGLFDDEDETHEDWDDEDEDDDDDEPIEALPAEEAGPADHPSEPELRVATVLAGTWHHEGETLLQSAADDDEALLLFGPAGLESYDLSAEIQYLGGGEGPGAARLLFHVQDEQVQRGFWLEHAEQAKAVSASRAEGAWSSGGRYRDLDPAPVGTWTRLRLEVRGERAVCYVGDTYLFMVTDPDLSTGRIGLGTRGGAAGFRNIEVRESSGALVWRGLPQLLAAAAEPKDATERDGH